MLAERRMEDWIEQYERSHQHPVNRALHMVGIPMIASSLPLFMLSVFVRPLRRFPAALFITGWAFQLIGHAFEGKPPEFLRDWRFLLVGLRWWLNQIGNEGNP